MNHDARHGSPDDTNRVIDAQAERLRERAMRQEEEEKRKKEAEEKAAAKTNDAPTAANDAPAEPAKPAEPEKLGELHMEIFADGRYNITAPLNQPEFIMNCISMLIQTLIRSQVQMQLNAAIAKAEAQIPHGTLPVWRRVRATMQAAVKKMFG